MYTTRHYWQCCFMASVSAKMEPIVNLNITRNQLSSLMKHFHNFETYLRFLTPIAIVFSWILRQRSNENQLCVICVKNFLPLICDLQLNSSPTQEFIPRNHRIWHYVGDFFLFFGILWLGKIHEFQTNGWKYVSTWELALHRLIGVSSICNEKIALVKKSTSSTKRSSTIIFMANSNFWWFTFS